ncbi:hypothetical protein PIB30_087916, partial [Stylosanthes scabra]|nr:hypothetical protein [Stylosanthes scabra]
IPAATSSTPLLLSPPCSRSSAPATLSTASSHLRRILPSTELPGQPQQTCIAQRVSSSQRREGGAGPNRKGAAEPPVRSAARLTEHLFCSNPISKNCKLLSGTVSLAAFNNSAVSYVNGYDELTKRECEEAGSEGMTFLACVVDSIIIVADSTIVPKPHVLRIGALITLNAIIERSATCAILDVIDNVNANTIILPHTKLELILHDTIYCSGYLGIVKDRSGPWQMGVTGEQMRPSASSAAQDPPLHPPTSLEDDNADYMDP